MKLPCRPDRVLSDHRVSDKQNLGGRQFALQHAQLIHQRVINVQAPGGVHQDHVMRGEFRFPDRAARDFERLVGARAGPAKHVDRLRHLRKLFARRGAIDVGGNHERPVAMRGEPLRELARRGRLA